MTMLNKADILLTRHVPRDNRFGRAMLLARLANDSGMLKRFMVRQHFISLF